MFEVEYLLSQFRIQINLISGILPQRAVGALPVGVDKNNIPRDRGRPISGRISERFFTSKSNRRAGQCAQCRNLVATEDHAVFELYFTRNAR